MRRLLILVFGLLLAVALVVQASGAGSSGGNVLEFNTMFPVSGPFVGAANPIRGVNGGGLPWQLAGASGRLGGNGSLEVEVHGLVLLNAAPVPPALRGTNPISSFRAIVSCLTISNGSPTSTNVASVPFPATATGNAEIHTSVTLPSPCVAPIIFVGPSPTAWFAATGTS